MKRRDVVKARAQMSCCYTDITCLFVLVLSLNFAQGNTGKAAVSCLRHGMATATSWTRMTLRPEGFCLLACAGFWDQGLGLEFKEM